MNINEQFDQRKTVLDNGLVVLSEAMSHVHSVGFGVFLRTGSRFERAEQNGLTHFIEHAVFKGTRRRSALQIAKEADALGGNLNAYTGRESVGFHNEVIDEDLARGFELLADLIAEPAFDPVELDKERNVIFEEIKMTEDAPDDLLFDIFTENFYPNHPLGRRVLGTTETLPTFAGEPLWSYYQNLFCPENIVIAAAGNLQHEEVLELAQQHFGHFKKRALAVPAPAPAPNAHLTVRQKADLEQAHLVLGMPCASLLSSDFYAINLLAAILGGGMSSRLFQSIREERGLAYDVWASANQFKDAGYFELYAATSADRIAEALTAMLAELRRLKTEPVSAEELERTRGKLRAGVILSLESSAARLSNLVSNEIVEGRFVPLGEVMAKVEAVTATDLQRVANQIFQPALCAATAIGDLKQFKLKRSQLDC